MPVSVTKSKVTTDCIKAMVQKAFDCDVIDLVELTEGYFNIAYKITLAKGEVILKIAPPMDIDVMTHEINIMYSEVDSMAMIKRETKVPVPNILYYDDSKTLCESSYFFMEKLEGCSFSSCKNEMTNEEKDIIFYHIGQYTKMLNQLTNDKFGYYGQLDKQDSNWYRVFRSILCDAYYDAERKDILLPISKDRLLTALDKEKEIFEDVKVAKFVHWDIWAGNVFVHNHKITGIIDFERCLWADELMEVGFRTYGHEKAFFHGYGINNLKEEELRRARWYDIYLFLISCLECDYRRYDNLGIYQWGWDMLKRYFT